ncbi:Receptor-like cytosolic serine/threonine-protein kinase RBK1 [Camellia lanceoleosa]|uniref:Receptor-like cytosolic serine/threonine-protein kinase RBK1 n=1 Tax=Camellia lanceoleosa TaxID=1840588 RepID=A0ACC0ITM2_9ERIC|nr:Receptor-like cytosolic serine/threonine-protein kinase RBK1 [Camellia lanceoleosa]
MSVEEIEESPKTESVDEIEKEADGDNELSSPRGVLEVPVSDSSDSDNSSISSCESSGSERSVVHRALFGESQGGLHWKSFIDTIKMKSVRRFTTIPLLSGYDISKKNLIKKLGRNQSADDDIDCGDMVVPKPSWRSFSRTELVAATDNFNSEKLIGKGGHAEVYKGCLPDGQVVAVKRITKNRKKGGQTEGLLYLHCECPRRIILRDITASNILLAEDYKPQISDFGLAKWLPEKWLHHILIMYCDFKRFKYMAPEYFMHGIVDEKTDIFAFGVLLLEIITGHHAVDSYRQSLVMWAKPLLENSNVKDIADPSLGDAYDSGEMKRVMSTALACLHHLPDMRPNMTRVVQLLRGEGGQIEVKQKSIGGRAIILDACDLENYTSTCYLKDLNRHMQLVLEENNNMAA